MVPGILHGYTWGRVLFPLPPGKSLPFLTVTRAGNFASEYLIHISSPVSIALSYFRSLYHPNYFNSLLNGALAQSFFSLPATYPTGTGVTFLK